MEFRSIRLSKLCEGNPWRIEFLLGRRQSRVKSRYPLTDIGDLVDERAEFIDPSKFPDWPINYIGLEHVESLTGDLVDYAPRHGSDIRSRSKVFRTGDVLYGRLRPYLNKVFLADGQVKEGACSGEFLVLIPDTGKVRARYLRSILASSIVLERVKSLQTGSTHPRLRLRDLLSIRVPLPPLRAQQSAEKFLAKEEQRRLAAKDCAVRLPEAVSNSLVNWLEGDEDRQLRPVKLIPLELCEWKVPLPPVDVVQRRRRKGSGELLSDR